MKTHGLESPGHTVLILLNGREAMEVYGRPLSKIDLVFLSLQISEVDGGRSLERIRGIRQDARVIVASGCVDTETRARLKSGGAHEVLQKPYRMDRLSAAIRNVLDA